MELHPSDSPLGNETNTIALITLSAHVVPILLFDPRREHSSAPTASLAAAARRAYQGWPRLRGHPKGLALIGPSTVASSIGSGLEAASAAFDNPPHPSTL
jgi:hypothetical protein